MKLQVVLEPSEEGGYTVSVPSLPGCISEGDDLDEALSNIQEAIELYLEPIDDDLAAQDGVIVRELVV
ncbi:MAG: type II toxin-antitoxin system HicB family antitoxin [Spirulinaceae cyanobacterium]